MAGPGIQVLLVSNFDDSAQVHHRHPVGHVFNHTQVMCYEQVRQPEAFLQVLHQVDDLCLYRHVEGRDRFVADDEARSQRECARNTDTLTLAARELVRIASGIGLRQANQIEQFADSIGSVRNVVDVERLADDLGHRHTRVKGTKRVLKDDLHISAA